MWLAYLQCSMVGLKILHVSGPGRSPVLSRPLSNERMEPPATGSPAVPRAPSGSELSAGAGEAAAELPQIYHSSQKQRVWKQRLSFTEERAPGGRIREADRRRLSLACASSRGREKNRGSERMGAETRNTVRTNSWEIGKYLNRGSFCVVFNVEQEQVIDKWGMERFNLWGSVRAWLDGDNCKM